MDKMAEGDPEENIWIIAEFQSNIILAILQIIDYYFFVSYVHQ